MKNSASRMQSTKYIGKSIRRKEGIDKVTGKACYIDDLHFEGMIHGVTIRSPIARGKIKKIEFLNTLPGNWDEFTVVTAKDIPAKNVVLILSEDQPFLAKDFVNHPEEPVLLIAHPNKSLAIEARNHIRIHIDPMPGVFTIQDSIEKKQVIWGEDNLLKKFTIEKGSFEQAVKNADHLIEDEYETGAQEQLYIENNGMIAIADADRGVTVWGSMQCPYYIHKALCYLFNMIGEKVRVIQVETGGGFGGKEEYPSILAGHAALLSMKSKKPVKMIYDRLEDMVATTKRHPSRTRIRSAVRSDGKILGMDIDFALDGGAYVTLSPVVLSRGGIHAAGPYSFENVNVLARAVATNTPPHGAFRGFGAPQSIFAMEKHLDNIAHRLKISPIKIREINLIEDGQSTSTGQIVKENVDMKKLMHRALELAQYSEKTAKYKIENQKSSIKKGIGFATFMHGAGFTGSGEKYLSSIAAVEADEKGFVKILASSTEIGQGKNTVFSQIAAEALGINIDYVDVLRPDTAHVPNSGPTVASRTVMVVGNLIEKACIQLKLLLQQAGFLSDKYSTKEWIQACANYHLKFGSLKSFSQYKQPSHIVWDDKTYKGEAYATYAWACYVAEVSVDTVTFETKVDDFVAVQEIGRVVNPKMAEGQIEGGVAQAIGYALYEKVQYQEGRMMNNTMTNYIMPTSMDLPEIRVFFEESPCAYGPGGAKGIGELPMDGAAPAILNAVQNATGIKVNKIPMTPEVFMEAMRLQK